MALGTKESVSLVNGRYVVPNDCSDDVRFCPLLTFDSVKHGVLAGIRSTVAAVVLTYHSGGTADWQYVYLFALDSSRPRLLAWLRTGSRAAQGLREVSIIGGDVVLVVNDFEKQQGDCCSAGTITTRYRWKAPFQRLGNRCIKSIRQASIAGKPPRRSSASSARTSSCLFWTAKWPTPIRWLSKMLPQSAKKSSGGSRQNGSLITAVPAMRLSPLSSGGTAWTGISLTG